MEPVGLGEGGEGRGRVLAEMLAVPWGGERLSLVVPQGKVGLCCVPRLWAMTGAGCIHRELERWWGVAQENCEGIL